MIGKICQFACILSLWVCIDYSNGQYCGVPSIKPSTPYRQRIIGGQTPIANSWPWAVALITRRGTEDPNYSGSFGCSATLINPNNKADESDIVLTAAHCVTDSTVQNLFIYLGGTDWNNRAQDKKAKLVPVKQIIRHAKYVQSTGNVGYDIAVIKLSTPVKFSPFIQPACLPTSKSWTVPDNSKCYAVGYGARSDANKQYAILQQLYLPIDPNIVASDQQSLGKGPDRIYAKNPASNTGVCYGDSGSGLYCNGNDKWFVVGDLAHFTNWSMTFTGGLALCEGNGAVYASAIHSLDWIQSNSK